MSWTLRYAPHLGYKDPGEPLFSALAGPDPVSHVKFARERGMGGILYPWAASRSPEERDRVAAALVEFGLDCGCIASTPRDAIMEGIWVAPDSDAVLVEHVSSALRVAKSLGSRTLVVLVRGRDGLSRPVMWDRAADRLRRIADLAGRQDVILSIEPMIVIPDMLLRTFSEAVEFAQEVDHPGVKLTFDTGHVFQMGDDLLPTFVDAYDHINTLQLADMPGRMEVGAGEINFVSLLAHAIRRGYDGLVELEHQWSQPGVSGEQNGLEMLSSVDLAAKKAAQG
ncbi:sugar phosphate isomerase/epimerase family protein [Bradyrhizobium betae]|uniref:Xylose isomerase-like TIM barrel domain-containing protein n=1 Tax=Bradyrhizobium betae TaxID=244734 RepID=A0A4Q1VS07_9BRAD|nr:sugar phosphate isomerase/epimerase family protein [Bradyrhizobium betae]RXT54253.1 hypothetical protein B5V03_02095 [Bradyrhizobium betae]